MEKIDAGTLKPEVQRQLHHQANRTRKRGFTCKQIAETNGGPPSRNGRWRRANDESGPQGVKIKPRGRRTGSRTAYGAEPRIASVEKSFAVTMIVRPKGDSPLVAALSNRPAPCPRA